MSDNNWQRARSTEQVEHRVQEILKAAESLFTTVPYENITLQKIARKAGFSQSNLYRYFKTREEIFLRIYLNDLKAWEEALAGELRKNMALESFIELWTEIFCRQERLMQLSPLLMTVLERNSSEGVYRATKLEMKKIMIRSFPLMEDALPGLSGEGVHDFMMFHGALVAGLFPMSRCTGEQKKILREIGLDTAIIEFKPAYKRAVSFYLKGFLAEKREA